MDSRMDRKNFGAESYSSTCYQPGAAINRSNIATRLKFSTR